MRKQSVNKLLFENQDDKPKGSIIRKAGSRKLYVLFHHFGRRIEKTTGLDDNPSNEKQVRTWLDRQMEKIKSGKFVFAEAFPSAPDSEKEWFAKQEGWDYAPSAKNIVIGDYLKKWDKEILEQYESSTKKFDYKQIIKCWIEPYFGQMTFYELTRFELQKFIGTLKCKIGKNKGETLSSCPDEKHNHYNPDHLH